MFFFSNPFSTLYYIALNLWDTLFLLAKAFFKLLGHWLRGVGVQRHGVTLILPLTVVTLTFKILSGLYLGNRKV